MPVKLRVARHSQRVLILVLFLLVSPARGQMQGAALGAPAVALAPVRPSELRSRALEPGWDVGIFGGACGVGQQEFWEETEFCGGAIVDALWLRRRVASLGLGVYAQTATSGFNDFRASAGGLVHVPVGGWASFAVRGGALGVSDAQRISPGLEGYLDLGLRALNLSGRYSLTHALSFGVQQTFGQSSRAGTTLLLALRVDAFWLIAPIGMLRK